MRVGDLARRHGIPSWEAVGMPNGRNAECIFGQNADGRNADSYCPISGKMPKTGVSRKESVAACYIHRLHFVSITKPKTSRSLDDMKNETCLVYPNNYS